SIFSLSRPTSTSLLFPYTTLFRSAIEYARNYFRQHPDERMVSLSPSDGLGFCECARCAAVGSVSDQVFTLVNQVARAIRDEFPEDRKSTRLNSSHVSISYAVFCLK